MTFGVPDLDEILSGLPRLFDGAPPVGGEARFARALVVSRATEAGFAVSIQVLVAATTLLVGLTLMLVGMGTVFVFLTVLVIAMTLMSAILVRLHVIEAPAETAIGVTGEEVAAITAAIAAHRKK